jgi:general secretion pathway protein D
VNELIPGQDASVLTSVGPSVSTRSATTVVVVKDQQTVVIGGLMGDKITNTVSKIPLLGDIPLIGWLFRNTASTKTKTNLLLFLTPYVINDTSDLSGVFFKKVQERRKFLDENDIKERDSIKEQTTNAKPLPYFVPEEEKKRLEEERAKENEEREKMRKDSDILGKTPGPAKSENSVPAAPAETRPLPTNSNAPAAKTKEEPAVPESASFPAPQPEVPSAQFAPMVPGEDLVKPAGEASEIPPPKLN